MAKFFKILLVVLLVLPFAGFGQSCCGTPPPPPPPPSDPGTDVPFDGGLTILLAAGAVYGLKSAARRKVRNSPSGE